MGNDTRPPVPARLPPGTACTLNDHCPWPERRGLLAIVMPTDGAEHEYPVHGLGRNEVIVHISEDPWEPRYGTTMLANGVPWTCVMPRGALSPLVEGDECPACGGFGDCGRCDGDGCGSTDPRNGYCVDGTCVVCKGTGLIPGPASPLPHPEGEQ